MPASRSDALDALNLVNAGYVADLYDQYRRDPSSVADQWRELFDSGAGGFEPVEAVPSPQNGNQPVTAPAEGPAREAAPAAAGPSLPDGATPIKGVAARLAQNMTASLGVPTATSFRDVDVAALEARRKELNGQIAPRKVSFTHLIGLAIVQAALE
jgi:multifunctional 2-oxoglutarate metabolism enzyme